MIEVARLADVGTMTVSRVLNSSVHVSAETARRVHEAIERLGYRPNEMARGLRGAKSKSIGLIVPSLTDPFFAICAHNVNAVAQSKGYSTIITTSNENPDTEFSEAEWMLQKHVEGLVLCPSVGRNSRFSDKIFQRIPIISFDRPLQGSRFSSVVVDNHVGAKLGTQHLIEHGHKRILFLGDRPDLFTIRTRHQGYRRALLDAGLKTGECLDCDSEDLVFKYVKTALAGKNPPTAFFSGNNRISRYLFRALRNLGVRVPTDIATVGFDDFDMADMMQPPLTVIRQPVEALGKTAAEALFNQFKAKAEDWPAKGSRITLKVELVLRSSCGCTQDAPKVIKP